MATLIVYPWPGPSPTLQDGVLLIGTHHQPGTRRADARARIREALKDTIARTLDIPASTIAFPTAPGQAPRVVIAGLKEPGLSISHADTLSVAAVHLHGPVGLDLMQVETVPDWEAVARDYLGPTVTRHLQQVTGDQLARAFTRAWCLREASLKCAGRALEEWSATPEPIYQIFDLDLPHGLIGVLARDPGSEMFA